MGKDLGIETLRTMAMFWIVFAHVAGISPGAGLGYSETPTIRYLMQTVEFFPVPMFVVIAGLLYSRKPTKMAEAARFCWKKFLSIMLPAVGVGILLYAAKTIGYQGVSALSMKALLNNLLFPLNHLWFLYALFWTYVLVAVLESLNLLNKPNSWFMVTLALVVLDIAVDVPTHFMAVEKILYMLPFFLMGYGLYHYQENFWPKSLRPALLILSAVLLVFNQWCWFADRPLGEHSFLIFERIMSWVILPMIFIYRPTIRSLAVIGPLTLVIYLFHPFGAAFSRIALLKFTDIENPIVLFVLCYTVAVVSSLVIFWAGRWVIRKLRGAPAIAENLGNTPSGSK